MIPVVRLYLKFKDVPQEVWIDLDERNVDKFIADLNLLNDHVGYRRET